MFSLFALGSAQNDANFCWHFFLPRFAPFDPYVIDMTKPQSINKCTHEYIFLIRFDGRFIWKYMQSTEFFFFCFGWLSVSIKWFIWFWSECQSSVIDPKQTVRRYFARFYRWTQQLQHYFSFIRKMQPKMLLNSRRVRIFHMYVLSTNEKQKRPTRLPNLLRWGAWMRCMFCN